MTANKITTLGEFLQQSGAKYRIFDMGRRVTKLSSKIFSEFESAVNPYPQPFQKKALFGIVFWNPKLADKHYVWFLNFPLDEQGLLIQAARDEFLVMLLDRVGECMLAAENGGNIEGALKDSPYTFKPREDKMAAFNAQATKALNKPTSNYYAPALAYFSGEKELNTWQILGMQGVADVAVRAHDNSDVIKTLSKLPKEPFLVFAGFLENVEINAQLTAVIAKQQTQILKQVDPDIAMLCVCLRATSNTIAQGLLNDMVMTTLQHRASTNIEVLATISGRCWHVLADETICRLFIERLASNDAGQTGFNQLLADVMYLPNMRLHIMKQLRSAERTETVSQAVGEMLG